MDKKKKFEEKDFFILEENGKKVWFLLLLCLFMMFADLKKSKIHELDHTLCVQCQNHGKGLFGR